MLPGIDFYFKEDELFFRLAFVDFKGKKVLKAFDKKSNIDDSFVQNNCANVYNGIKQIKRFVSNFNLWLIYFLINFISLV